MTTPPMTDQELDDLYRDLHAHPELSFQETRTAAIVADRLTEFGYAVHTGIGGTGVVGVLKTGTGPTVLLRADMDGLPVQEQTGLEYASSQRATDRFGFNVPVMHACGHDLHTTCLLGAASQLARAEGGFSGTLLIVFQPAEELGAGANAMLDDGLYDRFGTPDVVLGQHVAPLPAGVLGLHAGAAMAASDTLKITLHGVGGHGSRPETTVDPIVMAAATILRLQTILARETASSETAVLTVGTMHAGTAPNIVPDVAELTANLRTFEPEVRERILAAVARIVTAEAQASGATQRPEITQTDFFPALVNDPEATEKIREVFATGLPVIVIDPGLVTGSEDVAAFATRAGAPCAFWLLGGADPALFAGATTEDELREVVRRIPSNHSPTYAPVPMPTLRIGVDALVAAANAMRDDFAAKAQSASHHSVESP